MKENMTGCEGYTAIAHVYEKLNKQINYKKWADFFEAAFEKYAVKKPELILDLACGTGVMTRELSKRGYDMIGIDGSDSMLNEAIMKRHKGSILWLLQDMRSFELYGTVDVVTCCLDSINYLLEEKDVAKCFATVHNYLNPDGLFLFDMNSKKKFSDVYGNHSYILEDTVKYPYEKKESRVFCGWQNHFDKSTHLCDFYLSIFEENADGTYTKTEEKQTERYYSENVVQKLLEDNGFELIGIYKDFQFSPIDKETHRWYFIARAKK